MIFTPAEARKIKRGKQTMTVRHVTRHKRADGSYTRPAPCKEGDLIPCSLSGHGEDPVCLLTITHKPRRATIADLKLPDVIELGHRTTPELHHHLAQIWRLGPINEDTGQHTGTPRPSLPIWIIRFQVCTDPPRLLTAKPIASAKDYTWRPGDAIRGEPEAVPARAADRMAKEAREKERVTRREAWDERRAILEAQLEALKQAGLGREVSKEIRGIEARLRRIDQRLAA